MGKTTLSSTPAPQPTKKKESYFVRKFMVCLFIDRLNLGYGQCLLSLPRLLFIIFLRREMHFSRFARVRCFAIFV